MLGPLTASVDLSAADAKLVGETPSDAAGVAVGLVKVRVFRPFPVEALRQALAGARRVVVLDRNCSYGASGIFYQELRAAMCDVELAPPIHGFIAGMGGRDVTPATVKAAVRMSTKGVRPAPQSVWLSE